MTGVTITTDTHQSGQHLCDRDDLQEGIRACSEEADTATGSSVESHHPTCNETPRQGSAEKFDISRGHQVEDDDGITVLEDQIVAEDKCEISGDEDKSGEDNNNENDDGQFSFRAKVLRTIFIDAAYLGVTLNLGLIGPSLLDFEITTGASTSELATIFTWRAALGLAASLLLGPVLDRCNHYYLTGGALLAQALLTAYAPWCSRVELLVALLAIPEFFGCLIGMATHLICTELWQKHAGPSLQTLNLMATIGYTVSPLLVKPFLARIKSPGFNPHTIYNTSLSHTLLQDANITDPEFVISMESVISEGLLQTKIQYAYLIVAAYDVVVSMVIVIIAAIDGDSCRRGKKVEGESNADQESTTTTKKFVCMMAILFFFFNVFYGGIEVGYAGLLTTFTVKFLGWTKEDGTSVTAVLQGSNAAITAITVIISRYIEPGVLITVDILVVFCSMLVLSFLATHSSAAVWICTATLGAGYATIMPATFTYINQHLVISGSFSSAYWSGFFVGFMTLPTLAGYLFEVVDPMWLPYMMLTCACAMMTIFIIISITVWIKNKSQLKSAPDEV